jgi:isoleucyl-tRNA synthetase
VAGQDLEKLKPYASLIRDELNVKNVNFDSSIEHYATFQLQVAAKQLGPKICGKVQEVIKASKSGAWKTLPDGRVEAAGVTLDKSDFTLGLKANEGVAACSLPSNDAVVVLDTTITKALEQEGMARDVVRLVQQARREAGLHVADHIRLGIELSPEAAAAVQLHAEYVKEQTLADELKLGQLVPGFSQKAELVGTPVTVSVSKV